MRSDARKKLAPTEQPYDTSGDSGDKWEILRGLAEHYASLKSAPSVAMLGQGALDLLDETDSLAALLDASIDAEKRLEADLARKDETIREQRQQNVAMTTENEGLRAALVEAQRERDALKVAILDIDAHATPMGLLHEDDPDGSPEFYHLTPGALHRALGQAGHSSAKCEALPCPRAEQAERQVRAGLALADEWEQSGFEIEPAQLRAALSGVSGPTDEPCEQFGSHPRGKHHEAVLDAEATDE